MSAEQRKQRIRDGFSGLAEGDSAPLADLFADDVQWTIIGDTRFSGTYNGMADVGERLLTPIGELLEGHLRITVDNLMAEGDYVVCQGRGESDVKAGGTYNNTYCWVYRWSGEKIIAVTEYLDTECITAAFGAK